MNEPMSGPLSARISADSVVEVPESRARSARSSGYPRYPSFWARRTTVDSCVEALVATSAAVSTAGSELASSTDTTRFSETLRGLALLVATARKLMAGLLHALRTCARLQAVHSCASLQGRHGDDHDDDVSTAKRTPPRVGGGSLRPRGRMRHLGHRAQLRGQSLHRRGGRLPASGLRSRARAGSAGVAHPVGPDQTSRGHLGRSGARHRV